MDESIEFDALQYHYQHKLLAAGHKIKKVLHGTQCDHFQQFYNRCNVKVHVPIIRWSHCGGKLELD